MASKLNFSPMPAGARVVETRDTQSLPDGIQLDGARIEIDKGAFNANVVILPVGKTDGLERISPLAGECENGVLADGRQYVATSGLQIDIDVYSRAGSGPFTLAVEFDTEFV